MYDVDVIYLRWEVTIVNYLYFKPLPTVFECEYFSRKKLFQIFFILFDMEFNYMYLRLLSKYSKNRLDFCIKVDLKIVKCNII